MQELIYTSAPRLLEAGKTGFGTLMCTKGMPQPLVSYLERISAFDRGAGVDALQYYTTYRMGRVLFHVFSRVGDCGADYTGRTNHIAHHFVIEEETPEADALLQQQTPASVLMGLEGLWVTTCPSAPGFPEERFPAISQPDTSTSEWEKLTGAREKARWMGLQPYDEGCCLVISEVARTSLCLQLLHEGYLCKKNNGWGCGFATACTGTLGANLVPVTCLDARQSAAGVNPGRATPVLEVTNALVMPPELSAHAEDQDFAPPISVVEQPPPESLPPSTEQLPSAFSVPLQTPVSVPPTSPPRRAPVGRSAESDHVSFAVKVAAALVVLAAIFFIFRPGKEERLVQPAGSKPGVSGIPEKHPSGEKQSTPFGPSTKKPKSSGKPSVEVKGEEPSIHGGEKSEGRKNEGATETSSEAPVVPPASGGDLESASDTPLPKDASSTDLATSSNETAGAGKGDAVGGEVTATERDVPSSPHREGQSDDKNDQGTHETSPSDTQSSPGVQGQRPGKASNGSPSSGDVPVVADVIETGIETVTAIGDAVSAGIGLSGGSSSQSENESAGNSSKSFSFRDGDSGVQVKVATEWKEQTERFDVAVTIVINKEALRETGYSEEEGWELYYGTDLWSKPITEKRSFSEFNPDVKEIMMKLNSAVEDMKEAAEEYDGAVGRNGKKTTVSEILQTALKDAKKWKKNIKLLKEEIQREKSKAKTEGARNNESPSGEEDNTGGKEQDRETKNENLCHQLLECINRYEQARKDKVSILREAEGKIKTDYKKRVRFELTVVSVQETDPKNAVLAGKFKIKGKEEHEREKHE